MNTSETGYTRDFPPDRSLVEAVLGGNVQAYNVLMERYQVPLLRFLQRTLSRQDAEDVLQETFLRAWDKLKQYDPRWEFSTWIYQIAYRLSLNHLRTQIRRKRLLEHAPGTEVGIPVDIQLGAQEDKMNLWNTAAQVLNTPQYTALWLFYSEEMSLREVAQVMGCTVINVKALLFRARRNLKRILPPE